MFYAKGSVIGVIMLLFIFLSPLALVVESLAYGIYCLKKG